MRTFNILDDVELVLHQAVMAIPDIFLDYENVELVVDDEDRPTRWDIVVSETEDFELVLGYIEIFDDFSVNIHIYDADAPIISE